MPLLVLVIGILVRFYLKLGTVVLIDYKIRSSHTLPGSSILVALIVFLRERAGSVLGIPTVSVVRGTPAGAARGQNKNGAALMEQTLE